MARNPSPAETPTGVVGVLLSKLNPAFLAFAILAGLLLLASILSLAVYRGSGVSILGIRIDAAAQTPGRTDWVPPTSGVPAVAFVTAEDLSSLSEEHFSPNASGRQLTATIWTLVQQADELRDLENNFSFRVLKLELLIPRYGSYIDVRTHDADRTEAYRRIQSVLKEVGYFDGPITGDQQSTYHALVAFQKDHNEREGRDVISPVDLGLFGYGTLEAIRRTYRLTKG